MRYLVLALAGCAACTVENPNYLGPGDGGLVFGHGSTDLALGPGGGADLASSTGAGGHDGGGGHGGAPDLAPPLPLCTSGARQCSSPPAVAAQVCTAGGWSDRACPAGSLSGGGAVCMNGYCQPPTSDGTTSCDTGGPLEQICSQNGNGPAQFSCQPFLTGAPGRPVEWWCAMAIGAGAGGAGASCSTGSDCHSGFCGSNGTCFWACQEDGDCPVWGMHCSAVTLDVEGTSVSATSCM